MTGKTNAVSGGAGFGHTVEFINEGANYARYMVTDGQSVAQPVPNPTKSGLQFYGWIDGSQNKITFPYTPADDKVLTAQFVTTREGMVLTEANKTVCVLQSRRYYKANAGWAIVGYVYLGDGYTAPLAVALTSAAARVIAEGAGHTGDGGSFTYHDITYYYAGSSYAMNGDRTSTATDAIELFKFYESTMTAAALMLVKRYLNEI